MKRNEIMGVCRKLVSEDCTCDWDNPGLLTSRSDKEVGRIYIALGATSKVMEVATVSGADTLLIHHPLIFKAVKKVSDQNFITRRLAKLIQADTSYYVMHINFDAASDCMADLVARRLGLSDYVPPKALGEMGGSEGIVSYGIGKSGVLKEKMTAREPAAHMKDVFGLPFVLVYGDELMGQKASRISVCPGAGGSEVEGALVWGAQALVTRDISHRQGIDTAVGGMAITNGGHYGLKRIFIPYMAESLRKNLGSRVELEQAPPQWPVVIV